MVRRQGRLGAGRRRSGLTPFVATRMPSQRAGIAHPKRAIQFPRHYDRLGPQTISSSVNYPGRFLRRWGGVPRRMALSAHARTLSCRLSRSQSPAR